LFFKYLSACRILFDNEGSDFNTRRNNDLPIVLWQDGDFSACAQQGLFQQSRI